MRCCWGNGRKYDDLSFNDSFPPVIDGVVNVLLNYADYLRRCHGAGIIVGTPEYPGADYDAYEYPVVAYPSLDTAAVTNGYRTGNPFSEKEISELASFAPDIIHSHCPASSTVIGRILREETGAPLVMTYHTKYDIDIRRFMKIRSVADETIRVMVSNIEACDEVWTVSRGAAESLRELGYEGDCIVMSNGVDFAKGRVGSEAVRDIKRDFEQTFPECAEVTENYRSIRSVYLKLGQLILRLFAELL